MAGLKCSSPARNVFIASDMFVCSVMSYLKVSSKDYLVASDGHVRLQSDVVFRGE